MRGIRGELSAAPRISVSARGVVEGDKGEPSLATCMGDNGAEMREVGDDAVALRSRAAFSPA